MKVGAGCSALCRKEHDRQQQLTACCVAQGADVAFQVRAACVLSHSTVFFVELWLLEATELGLSAPARSTNLPVSALSVALLCIICRSRGSLHNASRL